MNLHLADQHKYNTKTITVLPYKDEEKVGENKRTGKRGREGKRVGDT